MPTLPFQVSLTQSHAPQFIAPIIVSYAVAYVGTWASIKLAHELDLLDEPGERSSHTAPVPRFGGLGIALGFYVALAVFARSTGPSNAIGSYLFAIWVGGLFALLFGLMDDLRGIPALAKLVCQALCAAIPLAFGLHFAITGNATFNQALTFFWILFFMNAFNFMDGMDGNTAAFGIIVAAGMAFPLLLAWSMLVEPFVRVLVLVSITVALLAFMRFNVSRPARTFMGDGGSQMVGYVLALALVALPGGFFPAAFLLFWPFIYDVAYTLIKRSLRGENILRAHREHLYQRLLKAGLSHRQSLCYGTFFLSLCLLASCYSVVGYLQTRTQRSWFAGAALVIIATVAYTTAVVWHEKRAKRTGAELEAVQSSGQDKRR